MIEISEPLLQSKVGILTVHEIFFKGKRIGHIDVGFVQDNDVKTFRKHTKRKLSVGQPYETQLYIDVRGTDVTANNLGKKGPSEIVDAMKEKFKWLEDRDIYIMELTDASKKIVCKASEL